MLSVKKSNGVKNILKLYSRKSIVTAGKLIEVKCRESVVNKTTQVKLKKSKFTKIVAVFSMPTFGNSKIAIVVQKFWRKRLKMHLRIVISTLQFKL